MLREYDKLARTCAQEKATFPTYLLRLAELELLDRDRRATERRFVEEAAVDHGLRAGATIRIGWTAATCRAFRAA